MPNLPKIYTATTDENGNAVFHIDDPGLYQVNASLQGAISETKTINITETNIFQSVTLAFAKLTVKADEDGEVTLTDGTTTHTYTSDGTPQTYLVSLGTWICTMELDGDSVTKTVVVDDYTTFTTRLSFTQIFGVSWDGSSATTMTRTDDALSFSNPDPYVADGNHPGSSPFDNLMPWSGMRRVTIDGNELVEIPKFWYKITKTGDAMTFQIADGPVEGFSVSPAHMDRGDGVGERDYVYVGRYHCSSTNFKSTTGSSPMVSITKASARNGIHNLGSDYWQFDFAMFWTIRMLYIVEFADWDSQKVIGYGCGNGSSRATMGYTDSMPYHTGTMASSRTTYAASTQYRYIEGLWDNVCDWCDGIRVTSSTIYTYLNPSTYSTSSGGTNTGTRPSSSGCISSFGIPSVAGYEWALFPSSFVSNSNFSTYVADRYNYTSSSPESHSVGGSYERNRGYGMFYMEGNSSSNYDSDIGARLQYLPS